mmetsp:Transcript_8101/g.18033  ORF Transcript_8101/g.18033 Transcript_8101/m.18033 type:complete len:879 (+) Transcript_8101:74-2710(+)
MSVSSGCSAPQIRSGTEGERTPSLRQPQPNGFCQQLVVDPQDWQSSQGSRAAVSSQAKVVSHQSPSAGAAPAAAASSSAQDMRRVVSGPLRLIVGKRVEFWSETNQMWSPTEVIRIDPENGSILVSVKPTTWLNLKTQRERIRLLTTPSASEVQQVRRMMREGRVAEVAEGIFVRHSLSQADEAAPALAAEGLRRAGAEIDGILGVSGSTLTLKKFMRDHELKVVASDDFQLFFWELVWKWNKDHIHVLQRPTSPQKHDLYDCYKLSSMLGTGTFGAVYLATCKKTGAERAVKVLEKSHFRTPARAKVEIDNLVELDHPHIVKLYEHFEDKKCHYLVMDYCDGGDLQECIDESAPLPESFSIRVVGQVLLALAHVHEHGLLHMDVKPANIMLLPEKATLPPAGQLQAAPDDGLLRCPHVMLIDLGVAHAFEPGSGQRRHPRGTPTTMAPEVWNGDFTPLCDVFSLGCVLFEMLTKFRPFDLPHATVQEAQEYWAQKPQPAWCRLESHSPEVQRLCNKMLRQDRSRRFTVQACQRSGIFQAACSSAMQSSISRSQAAISRARIARLETPSQLWARLATASNRSILQRSVALAIAQRWPANRWGTVKSMFESLDQKGSGRLLPAIVAAALKAHGASEKLALHSADAMDANRDGKIEWTEFVAACIPLDHQDLEEDVRFVFNGADTSGRGLLKSDDIARLLYVDDAAIRRQEATDLVLDITGRAEAGTRVDWPTFYSHISSSNCRLAVAPPSKQLAAELCCEKALVMSPSEEHASDVAASPGSEAPFCSFDLEDPGMLVQVQQHALQAFAKLRGAAGKQQLSWELDAEALDRKNMELVAMGFRNCARNERVLRTHGNDLDKAVAFMCKLTAGGEGSDRPLC